MQIQASYGSNLNLPSVVGDPVSGAGQDQPDKSLGTETPEYKAILNQASRLLANPQISALERTQILNLLAIGQTAAANGAIGELRVLFNDMKNFDPGLGVKDVSFEPKTAKPQFTSDKKDESSVTYKDQSGDAGVSFSYPVSMNQYEAPLAVAEHEGEHVAIAQAEALINNENVTSYVAIHTGYDRNGKLIVTGGLTTTITHPKKQIEPVKIGNKVHITV